MNPWLYVSAAIALEVTGTLLLKLSAGFTKPLWGGLSILCYSACFWVLAPALKLLPVGVVYAIWAGVGIVAATLIGVAAFGERLGALQVGLIALILIGAVGLRLTATNA